MSNQTRLQLLFAKYLQRACTPQEVEELLRLLQQTDANELLDPQLRRLWEESKQMPANNTVNWQQMYNNITSEDKETGMRRKNTRLLWIRYTAAAALVPILGFSMYWYFSSKAPASRQSITAKTMTVSKQSPTKRQTIHLPDGSTVILNEGSRLNYPPAFGGKTRNVYLTGEGFFDIQHNPRQPFIVHSGKIAVRVLGTAFNVKTDAQSQQVAVTVTRGRVQVLNEDKSMGIVGVSQQLLYSAATGNVTQNKVDTLPVLAWKPAEIIFNDISMQEVAARMEERFAIIIEFANPAIKNCRVSATFSEDDLPEEILAVVCAVSKAEYQLTGKKIIISGKGCK